jgi:heme A synthase
VEKGLKEELVATHLGIAMLQIGLLLFIARHSAARAGEVRSEPGIAAGIGATRPIRVLAVLASVAVLATIVAGGYMSASELHGTSKEATAVDPHTACGTDFPSCGGEFMPFGRSRALDIHLTHRAFMYLATALVLVLFAAVLAQRRRLEPLAGRRLTLVSATTVAVLLGQVTLGALNVWLGEHAWLVVAHLAVATLLWVSLVFFTLTVLDAREPAGSEARRRTAVRPATAGGHA